MRKLRWPLGVVALGILVSVFGCGRGANKAQISLDRGMNSGGDVRTAFFVKSWGLNRALITEARQKWVSQASIAILEAAQNGTIESGRAREIVSKLEEELGKDEAVTSENFAYLAFLLMAGERSDQYLGQVDMYLESRKPIWKHLLRQSRENLEDIADELKAWEPLIKNLKNILPEGV